jgi:hypothetical protein
VTVELQLLWKGVFWPSSFKVYLFTGRELLSLLCCGEFFMNGKGSLYGISARSNPQFILCDIMI